MPRVKVVDFYKCTGGMMAQVLMLMASNMLGFTAINYCCNCGVISVAPERTVDNSLVLHWNAESA